MTENVAQPGSIDTDMNPANGLFGKTLRSITTLGRYGQVEDIADIVTFLAGPNAMIVAGRRMLVLCSVST